MTRERHESAEQPGGRSHGRCTIKTTTRLRVRGQMRTRMKKIHENVPSTSGVPTSRHSIKTQIEENLPVTDQLSVHRTVSRTTGNRLAIFSLLAALCHQLLISVSLGQFPQASPFLVQLSPSNQNANSLTASSGSPTSGTAETQLVRGLANWPGSRLELPCLVDQLNCGEIYYITWTRQQAPTSGTAGTRQLDSRAAGSLQVAAGGKVPWNRVYLYTGANDTAPHKPIGDLVGRAHFVMPAGKGGGDQPQGQQTVARLVIEEPQLSDEALYKCDVTYVRGKCPSISLVRVQLLALPERAQLFRLNSPSLSDSVAPPPPPLTSGQQLGPLQEHDQLELACLVLGGRPAPRAVFWRKIDLTGRTINLISTSSAEQQATDRLNTLKVSRNQQQQQQQVEVVLNHTLTSADLGARFECHVEHEALDGVLFRPAARLISSSGESSRQEPSDALLDLHPADTSINRHDAAETAEMDRHSLDSHVIIDLNVGVQSLDLFVNKLNAVGQTDANGRSGSGADLTEGDLIELECVARNSRPAANITWLNGSDVITNGNTELEAASTRRSAPVTQMNTGTRSQRNRRLLQRNLIQLNPNGLSYDTHSFLSIKLSRYENGVQMSCQAQNGPMRESAVKSVELQVKHAPIVLMEPAKGLVLNEFEPVGQQQRPARPRPRGNSVILSSEQQHRAIGPSSGSGGGGTQNQAQIYCIYTANPMQLLNGTTRWFKDGQPLLVNSERLLETSTPNGYPTLTIKRVTRQDAGKYDCQLTNSVGTSERLPAGEASRLEVNFRPSVQLRALKTAANGENGESQAEELDLERTLLMVGDELELVCETLEARPNQIDKFQWFAGPLGKADGQPEQILRPLTSSNGPRFKLGPLRANLSASLFACAASNSIGQSEPSNTIEVELSHLPGPSFVRPVTSLRQRKLVLAGSTRSHAPLDPLHPLASGDTLNSTTDDTPNDILARVVSSEQISAGKELLLECVTPELGRPRANIWLWFKDGQTIDANPDIQSSPMKPLTGRALDSLDPVSHNTDTASSDYNNGANPISDRLRQDLSSFKQRHWRSARLLAAGRFLLLPAIQLAHKGNYSCVALNRLGSAQTVTNSNQVGDGRDSPSSSFELQPAQAPAFVQPLAPTTNWLESRARQLELVCRVQCEPICQLEWLRNNEPLDIKNAAVGGNRNYFSYHVRHTIIDQEPSTNTFVSVESRLVLEFEGPSQDGRNNNHETDKSRPAQPDRDWLLARRHFLNSSNFTCQSGANPIGPPVRSSTRLQVQYPPESVIISAPSDKLNLVEGQRGPLLSCEASGEPQVRYRWLLLKGTAGTGDSNGASDLVAAHYSVKHFGPLTSNSSAGFSQQDNSSGNNKADQTPPRRQANDRNKPLASSDRIVELAGSSEGEQVGGTSVSMLDLSGVSMSRSQAGYYICEASNELGQTRQSIHVNVQYKPTCTTLHMHSLDLVQPIGELVFAGKPHGLAAKDEEYALVNESSEDFVGLRRLLLSMPLHGNVEKANKQQQDLDKFSFDSGIFGASLHTTGFEPKDDSSPPLLDVNPNELSRPSSWTRFNEILLKFLNDYSRLIRLDEERGRVSPSSSRSISDRNQQQQQTRRRSSQEAPLKSALDANDSDRMDEQEAPSSREHSQVRKTNTLTFACVAQEANPMVNLTFEWYFGATRLTNGQQHQLANELIDNSLGGTPTTEAATIYTNSNETLAIVLTRRLDSGPTLSPFQVSFITLGILDSGHTAYNHDELQSRSSQVAYQHNQTMPLKAPVIKSRYRSFYNSLQASYGDAPLQSAAPRRRSSNHLNADQQHQEQINNQIEITELNWREKLGQLLSCSVANNVGISDACHVKPLDQSALKRRKNLDELNSSSTSLYEFAKWRMPSLAQKSVLIISALIGCSLIVFATFAFLLAPHLRVLQLVQKKQSRRLDGNGGGVINSTSSSSSSTATTKDQDQNTIHTANSTSSQKSSVLGLLNHAADVSFPSSSGGGSDDDSSHRLHQLDSQLAARSSNMLELDAEARAGNNHFDYDLPRGSTAATASQRPRLVYQPEASNFHLVDSQHENLRFSYNEALKSNKQQLGSSASNRILASLKSKFKVQDRIADLPSSGRWTQLLHARNVSNSETNSTGLSLDKSFNSSASAKANSTLKGRTIQHSLGVPVNLRHSYAGAVRPTSSHQHRLEAYRQQTMGKPGNSYYGLPEQDQANNLENATYNRLLELNSQVLLRQTAGPMASDPARHQQTEPLNAMDEFMRRRGFDTPSLERDQLDKSSLGATYGNHSLAWQNQSASIYALRNDLIHLGANNQLLTPTGARIKPPVYPRSTTALPHLMTSSSHQLRQQQQHSNYQMSALQKPTPPPPVTAARAIRDQQMFDYRQRNGTYAEHALVSPYNDPTNGLIPHQPNFATIDNHNHHMNRLTNATIAYCDNIADDQQQLAYANTLNIGQGATALNQFSGNSNQLNMANNRSVEHIYDSNAYATPEQSPARRLATNSIGQNPSNLSTQESERLRVSQLIQTFNTKLPENSL